MPELITERWGDGLVIERADEGAGTWFLLRPATTPADRAVPGFQGRQELQQQLKSKAIKIFPKASLRAICKWAHVVNGRAPDWQLALGEPFDRKVIWEATAHLRKSSDILGIALKPFGPGHMLVLHQWDQGVRLYVAGARVPLPAGQVVGSDPLRIS